MTSPEQLKLWSAEVEPESTLPLFSEFTEWCARLNAPGLSTPLLKPTDKNAAEFVQVFHEVVADFEERERLELRRKLKETRTSDSLIEKIVSQRLLERVISECQHRRLQLPQEIVLLRAAIGEQIHPMGPIKTQVQESCAS